MTGVQEQTLTTGDRLARDEFLRRWYAAPDIKRAELINGVVYMPSPVSDPHTRMSQALGTWLTKYEEATPGLETGRDRTWLLPDGSVPQPDLDLFVLPEYGGRSRVDRSLRTGVPDLAVEVSISSRRYDLSTKLGLYRSAGVREYLVVMPELNRVVWYRLSGGINIEIAPDSLDVLRSAIFPGLWLNPAALFAGDRKAHYATLDEGLKTAEHITFAAQLAAARTSSH